MSKKYHGSVISYQTDFFQLFRNRFNYEVFRELVIKHRKTVSRSLFKKVESGSKEEVRRIYRSLKNSYNINQRK